MAPVAVIVGIPGSGKSTVGPIVADRMGVPFRETDADLEDGTGLSVADLMVTEGEESFRRRERRAVLAALAEHDGVLAVGGGCVGDADIRQVLRSQVVVWLDIDAATAVDRLGLKGPRPITLLPPRPLLEQQLLQYSDWYLAVCTHRVAAGGDHLGVATSVVDVLGDSGGRP